MRKGYFVERINHTADNDVTIIGQRFNCGVDATPYECKASAESAMKRQEKQDMEYCPECVISYKIVNACDIA